MRLVGRGGGGGGGGGEGGEGGNKAGGVLVGMRRREETRSLCLTSAPGKWGWSTDLKI